MTICFQRTVGKRQESEQEKLRTLQIGLETPVTALRIRKTSQHSLIDLRSAQDDNKKDPTGTFRKLDQLIPQKWPDS